MPEFDSGDAPLDFVPYILQSTSYVPSLREAPQTVHRPFKPIVQRKLFTSRAMTPADPESAPLISQ